MKIIRRFFLVLGVFFLAVVILLVSTFVIIKRLKIKDIVEQQIEQSLGIDVNIEEIAFSPLLAHISAKGITVMNPENFAEPELAYIEAIHLLIDPIEILVSKKPNIYVLALNLKRLNIIKNKEGKVNIKELIPIKNDNKVVEDKTPFYFDMLVLSVGQVRLADYSGEKIKEHIYPIGIKDATFIMLKDEQDVVRLIVSKAIENTDIGKIINLKIIPVVSQINDTFNSAWGTAKVGAKSIWGIVALPYNLVFGKN
ncbi:MAG: AsmA family protein [Candidatus Omnitrophota bacterium]